MSNNTTARSAVRRCFFPSILSLRMSAMVIAGLIGLTSGQNADSLKHLDSLQKAYMNLKFGMFLHFNMSTFARMPFLCVVGEHELGSNIVS